MHSTIIWRLYACKNITVIANTKIFLQIKAEETRHKIDRAIAPVYYMTQWMRQWLVNLSRLLNWCRLSSHC